MSTTTIVGTRGETRGRLGERTPRSDGVSKTSGSFAYASDLHRDGMLFGATLRSHLAYTRIRRLDLSGAWSSPGVAAVMTASDVPGKNRFGLNFDDQPVLAEDVVRYAGEPIAVLAAAQLP